MATTASQPAARQTASPTTPSDTCPGCGEGPTRTIYRVDQIPVHSCVVMHDRATALAYPRRDLVLNVCSGCGFVYNAAFDPSAQEYSTNFEESQHASETFNGFARGLAKRLADQYHLDGKRVLEIGCGKGEFLVELCRAGGCDGVGIDPGYRPERTDAADARRVRFIQDFYGPAYHHVEADLVVCRHTLEHIGPTQRFVADLRQTLGDRPTPVFFETPDAMRVLKEGAFWDIYYEHCSYFTAGTHARLFRQQRFEVTALELAYAGQYILQGATPTARPTHARLEPERDLDDTLAAAEAFPGVVQEQMEYWRELVRSAHRAGRRVVVWGGGSKAVSFVTTLGLNDEIDRVVDINPFKQGKFLPGSGHMVVGPEALRRDTPDLVVVMNPVYVEEIRKDLDGMGLHPEVVAL